MDDRGHWHDSETMKQFKADEEASRNLVPGKGGCQRPVIEIGIGEMVQIVKNGGDTILARFDAAEKNRVTLSPQEDGTPRPYLELAERVQLQRSSGEFVNAQVWDNRNGKIILRTLPI